MRIACCTPKTTNTHSEYVILNAFPLQQWLHERGSMLRYTYIARHVRVYLYLANRSYVPVHYGLVFTSTNQLPNEWPYLDLES
jgi:hypothetical protein